MKDSIIVGLSGGVDSAVAAAILVEKGYQVEGLFMKNWEEDSKFCTSEQDYKDALQICNSIDIPLRSVNFSKEYWEKVFKKFLIEYKLGRTPNPCVLCNTHIKCEALLKRADKLDCEFIATGHYANINKLDSRFYVSKGKDLNKDQSYALWGISQKNLSRTMFPLGNLEKKESR